MFCLRLCVRVHMRVCVHVFVCVLVFVCVPAYLHALLALCIRPCLVLHIYEYVRTNIE